jgi:hypothetical protein
MYKSYFKLFLMAVSLMFAILAGCGNLTQVSEPVNNGQGIALLKIAATAGGPFQMLAKTATLTISASDMLTMTKSLTITDSSVEGTITGIPAGKNRLFSVSVFDSLDTLQYQGSATANVIADSTVKVSINVDRVTGNAIVNGNIIEGDSTPMSITVGDINVGIVTSANAITWTKNSGSFQRLQSIANNGNLFVTVGYSGIILTSADGLNWTTRNSNITANLFSIVYGNKQFVAVGDGGVILTSSDGIAWATKSSGITTMLASVTFGGNQFVAVGGNSTMLTSPDGSSWTVRNPNVNGLNLISVAYGNGLFVVAGQPGVYNTFLTSSDAITWTSETLDTTYGFSPNGIYGPGLYCIVYGNGQFVATAGNIGASGIILVSSDGKNWTKMICTGIGANFDFRSIIYTNNQFIAAGNGIIATSPDALAWTIRYGAISGNSSYYFFSIGVKS